MRSLMYKQWANNSFLILVMRLVIGGSIFMHGAQKVLGWYGGKGLAGTAEGMAKMGIPEFASYLSSMTEFAGGILLVIGLLTRVSAFANIINMLVAIFMVHISKGFFAGSGGYELNLFYLGFAFVIFLTGPGTISIDNFIFKDSGSNNNRSS